MKGQRLLVVITVVNILLLLLSLLRTRLITAERAGPVLHGRALEIERRPLPKARQTIGRADLSLRSG